MELVHHRDARGGLCSPANAGTPNGRRENNGVASVPTPLIPSEVDPAHMRYSLTAYGSRLQMLFGRSIEAHVYFPPVHKQPFFFGRGDRLSVTQPIAKRILSIPFQAKQTTEELEEIAAAIEGGRV